MGKNIVIIVLLVFFGCKGTSQEEKEIDTATESMASNSEKVHYPVTKTDAEWKAQLTDMEYYILRQAGTENAFSSPLLNNKETGTYVCAGCDTPLFRSEHKFNSGTGWPSFDEAIEGNVGFDTDYKIGYKRMEEHCTTCGGHLGHLFEDGPKETTGLRHCIDGFALHFKPDAK